MKISNFSPCFYMNCRGYFFIPFLVFSGHETVIINGLNYFTTGSAQSKQVKQPTKLIFLLKLGQLFLSLTQLSPSLFVNRPENPTDRPTGPIYYLTPLTRIFYQTYIQTRKLGQKYSYESLFAFEPRCLSLCS